MSIKAVILDWAGTTVDYGCFAPVQAFVEVFRAYGIDPTMEETRAPMGMLKRDHIRTMLEMPRITAAFQEKQGRLPTEKDLDVMYASFEEKLFHILHQFCTPKPEVIDTIAALREQGIKIGSTTGYTDSMMALVTEGAKQQGYVPDCLVTPDSTNGFGRPFPYMVFENLRALQIGSVAEVLKVGDTVSDILEGKHAGIRSIGILEGSSEMGLSQQEYDALSATEQQVLKEKVRAVYHNAGADYVIDTFGDLLPLINALQ